MTASAQRLVRPADIALGASMSVRNLSVTYPNGFTAVRDASFSLDPGTICALVGVNGSGKSTIFKAIMEVRPKAPKASAHKKSSGSKSA